MINPNALINRSKVIWNEDDDDRFKRKDDAFGPPLYDESRRAYYSRQFMKGATFGKYTP